MNPVVLAEVTEHSAETLSRLLQDRALRYDLYGGRNDVSANEAINTWCHDRDPEAYRWAIQCCATQGTVGAVSIKSNEISYFIDPEFRNRGYAKSAIISLINLRPDIHIIVAHTIRENFASRCVLVWLGFSDF